MLLVKLSVLSYDNWRTWTICVCSQRYPLRTSMQTKRKDITSQSQHISHHNNLFNYNYLLASGELPHLCRTGALFPSGFGHIWRNWFLTFFFSFIQATCRWKWYYRCTSGPPARGGPGGFDGTAASCSVPVKHAPPTLWDRICAPVWPPRRGVQ